MKTLLILLASIVVIIIILSYLLTNSSSNEKFSVYVDKLTKDYTPKIVNSILDNIKDYKITDTKKGSDLCIEHILSHKAPLGKINIVISGESNTLNNSVNLHIGTLLNQNSIYNIYYPQLFSSLSNENRKSIDNKDYMSNKTKFCAYMYSYDVDIRVKYFDLISSYKRVDALGKSKKNTEIPDTRNTHNDNETYNDIAKNIYKNYKFVIAMENIMKPGYSTEKLINPIIANSIPIYWGDSEIFKYINKERVIYIPDFTDEQLLETIKRIDNNESLYNKIISQSIYVNNNTPEIVDKKLYEEIKEKMKLIL